MSGREFGDSYDVGRLHLKLEEHARKRKAGGALAGSPISEENELPPVGEHISPDQAANLHSIQDIDTEDALCEEALEEYCEEYLEEKYPLTDSELIQNQREDENRNVPREQMGTAPQGEYGGSFEWAGLKVMLKAGVLQIHDPASGTKIDLSSYRGNGISMVMSHDQTMKPVFADGQMSIWKASSR